VVRGVDMVMSGEVRNAFCAVRPARATTPRRGRRWGFCFFGSVVVGARHALEAHGLSRVAIVDFDVHHGNGTQDLVWDDARILFASTQQIPLYPAPAPRRETGAHGQIVNVPCRRAPAGPPSARASSAASCPRWRRTRRR
jgi:acetoin utilization deacetylase AcuC-like enzyme